MSHALLSHQDKGMTFEGIYYVESVFIKKTKANKDYTDLILRDKSGSRPVKFWGVISPLQKGEFLQIKGIADDYMGGISLIAKDAQKVDKPLDLSDYIPVCGDSNQNASTFDALQANLAEIEKKTGDSTASLLVKEVYGNGTFFQKFIVAPGSAKPYYGRSGGLLANTARVADQCQKAMSSYGLSNEEQVVLLSSALLFRVGAVEAFEFRDCMPIETKRGVLLGIDNLTIGRVTSALRRVSQAMETEKKKANMEIITRIFHSVASYSHGAIKPMTKEAIILAAVYRTDTEMVDAVEFIENDMNTSEEFTAYDPVLRRRYYTGARK